MSDREREEELALRLADVVARLGGVVDAFIADGRSLYVVGGLVRDVALGLVPTDDTDIDLTTDAPPDRTRELVEPFATTIWNQGERFGTIGAKVGGQSVEITTHRGERYTAGSRKPAVSYSTSIDDDLSRRDFTVNAMALRLPDLTLFDPFGGLHDLVARRLRTPLSADVSFGDDPLRMLRAARFVARFGLRPVPEVVAAVARHRPRVAIVSAERVADELGKLLSLPDPGPGLGFLDDTGLLGEVIPGWSALSASTRTMVVAAVTDVGTDPGLRLAVLLRPLGDEGAGGVLRALKSSTSRAVRVTDLIRVADAVDAVLDDQARLEDKGRQRLLRRLAARWPVAVTSGLEVAASAARGERRVEIDALTATLHRMEAGRELADLGPELSGGEVMDILGTGPGPVVGAALAHLAQLRIEDGDLGHERAVRELTRWWTERAGQ